MSCLDENELVAFGDGALSGEPLTRVASHLRECEPCRSVLASIYEASGRLRATHSRIGSGEALLSGGELPAFERGAALGRYLILEKQGTGGMGVVYSAYDQQLDRKVALKFLRTSRREESTQRLLREAQALARIGHPNVVTVYEVATHGDAVFIAMELVEGNTVAEWLKTKPDTHAIVEAFIAAGRGLAAAHAVGVIHRDFKPSNILRHRDGRIRVTDFGLARATPGGADNALERSTSTALTRSGELPGTPLYMAPEQLAGAEVDARADQFGLCVSLYEALYGIRPFAGNTPQELELHIRQGTLQRGSRHPPIDARVEQAIRRGLSAAPNDRFPDIQGLLTGLAPRPRSKMTWIAVAGVATLLAGVILVFRVREPTVTCPSSTERLGGVWDEDIRSRIRSSFSNTKLEWATTLGDKLENTLDLHAREWVRLHTEACEATWTRKEQSQHVLDLRMRCLEQRRTELGAVTRFLSSVNTNSIEKVHDVVGGLSGLQGCSDVARLEQVEQPLSPEARAASEKLRPIVADAKVLFDSGRFTEALTLLHTQLNELAALDDLSIQGEGFFQMGASEVQLGKPEAREHLLRALTAATTQRLQDLTVRTLAQLVELSSRVHDTAGVSQHRQLLELTTRHMRLDPELEGIVENQLSLAAQADGKNADALTHARASKAAFERVQGPASKKAIRVLHNIGALLSDQGKGEEALAVLQQATTSFQAEFGASHPDLVFTEVNLGVTYNDLGRFAEAVPHFERAEQITLKTRGESHPFIAAIHNNWGDACMGLKRPDEALEHFRKALTVRELQVGKNHLRLVGDLFSLAGAAQQAGRPEEAVQALERVVQLRSTDAEHPGELGRAEVALAKTLWTSAPARAKGLFSSADQHFAQGGNSFSKERDDARQWLAQH